jgi:hypothetical protein
MVEQTLIIAAFLALLAFVVMALQYELDLSLVVSSMLGASVISLGFMLAVGLQVFAGLSMLYTTVVLGGIMFMTAGMYELVS